MTTLYLHQPGEPPPVAILAGWLREANVANTTPAQLRAALMTGKDVPLGAGWLVWREE